MRWWCKYKKLLEKISVLEELIEEQIKQKNSSIQYDEEYFEKREEYLKILSKINDEIQNNTKEKMKISEKLNTIFIALHP